MPAPNVATYFDFESFYEDAAANYLNSVSGNPFAQILTPRTLSSNEAFFETPRVFVKMAMGSTGPQEASISGHSQSLYNHRRGVMTLEVASRRNDTTQNHGLLRGWARYAMQDVAQAFNSNNVPYYQTLFVTEDGAHQGVDPVNDEIATILTYSIEFALKSSELPGTLP